MPRYETDVEVLGPWSLTTSRTFWEEFAPAALTARPADDALRSVFRVEVDGSRAETVVLQRGYRGPGRGAGRW